jgi:hypothetical protein
VTATPDHAIHDVEEPGSTTPRVRASDADRHSAVHTLQDAVARGLLTADEGSERMAAAYAAQHLDELPPLTADLPAAAAPAPTAPGWRTVATLAWLQTRGSVSAVRAEGLRSRRGLAAAAGLVVGLLLLVLLVVVGLHLFGGDATGHGELRRH